MIVSSIIITICCNLLSEPIVLLFVGGKTATYDLAVSGFSVFCVTFLFSGYNIFSSALFTALSDGKTSAIISFTLPAILGVTGVWLAIPVAEFVTLFLSIFYQRRKRTVYHYA